MPDPIKTKVITLICERSVDLNNQLNNSTLKDAPDVEVVKYPCSGMIQPLMVEAAMKAGASGVIVCGCQIGDCYYREGNKMIRERLLGERPPGLKKTVDRRRVIGLWLSKPQTGRFISEAKEFVAFVGKLNSEEGPPKVEPAKPSPAAKPQPAVAKPAEPAGKATIETSSGEKVSAADAPVDKDAKPQKEKTEGKPAGEPEKGASSAQSQGDQTTKKVEESNLGEEGKQVKSEGKKAATPESGPGKKTDELAKADEAAKPAESSEPPKSES